MRPLHKKRKRRANAASLIVLINERTTRPHVFAVPQVRRRVYERRTWSRSGNGASSDIVSICSCMHFSRAANGFSIACPQKLTTLLALSLFLSLSASPRSFQLPSRLVVELFIRFCRVLHFLNLQFFWSALFLHDPPRPSPGTAYMRLSHSRLFTLRTCFIYFLINLMRQFCVAFCGALHTFRSRLRFDCVCSSATRNRKTQAHTHTHTCTHAHNVIRKLLHFVYSQRSCRSWRSM